MYLRISPRPNKCYIIIKILPKVPEILGTPHGVRKRNTTITSLYTGTVYDILSTTRAAVKAEYGVLLHTLIAMTVKKPA
jgi:hypothetical protein